MKKFTFLILILVLSIYSNAQGHFIPAFTGNGTDHMNIYVNTATIGEVDLEAGDEIAAFDGTVCCGVIILTQPIVLTNADSFAGLRPSKDNMTGSDPDTGDPMPDGDGYIPGHPISYKFWDSSKSKEISEITAVYYNVTTQVPLTKAPTFTPNGSAMVKLSVAAPVNHLPIANAGLDQSLNEGVSVTLDGSASSDPDSDPMTYKWTAPAGITLSSTTVAKPTFTAPEVTADKTYTFSLVVNDGTLNSDADEVVITVKNVNKIPVANAGITQTVNEGATVTLDGSASSDGDAGDVLTYTWTAPTGITLNLTSPSKPTFTAPEVTTDTPYTFSLIVNDGKADSPSAAVLITVKQVNKVPVAIAGPDQSPNEGTLVTLNGSASSDGDSDPLTYKWTAPTEITLSSNTAAKPTFTAPEVTVNTSYTFTLVVNDGTIDSPADQVVIIVKQVNKIPVANAGAAQTVNEGSTVTLDGTASTDGDSDQLTYSWTAPTGITLSSATDGKPTFTAPEVSADTPYTFSLIVNDGQADSPATQVIITVKQVNKVPVAIAGPDQAVFELTTYTLDGSASSDGDNNPLTYKWTAPAGITLSSGTVAKPTFSTPEVTVNTSYTFTLIVNDGFVDSPADDVIITVKKGNKTPLANAGANQTINENSLVTLDGSLSSDPDNDALTYLWTAPTGITLSPATVAKPTFTAPEVSTDTPYTFSLVVNDGIINSIADQIIITVKQVNKAPVANAGADREGIERKVIQLDGSLSSDFDNDLLTYLWTAPLGITLSSNTVAKPTFTAPDVVANTDYTFILIVNDGALDSPADEVVVTVIPNKAPIANAGPDQSVIQQKTVTLNGSLSSDPENDPLTYLWTAPAGIVLINPNSANPSFVAPVITVDTDLLFKLKVNDGELDSPEDEVIISILNNRFPVANAGVDFSANENSRVTLDGSASFDPEGRTLIFKWTAPAGITLNTNIPDKPTFTAPEVSVVTNYIFTLIVNDGTLDSPADEVVVTIYQVNKAPIAKAGKDQSVNEGVTVSLDGSASSDVDNDALIYKWTAPAGIILNISIPDKPTFTAPEVMVNTDYTFTLFVNDGALDSPADQVVVTVKQVNKAPVANAGSDQSVNEGVTATLNGTGSSDPDGNSLTYKWTAPAGITLSSNTVAKPTFTAPEVTQDTPYTFSLVVNDGTIDSPADPVIITVKQVNKAPVANAGPDQTINEGSLVTLDASASFDPDGDLLTYIVTDPDGETIVTSNLSKITFPAPEVATDTKFTFTLVVNDGTVNSVPVHVTITVKNVDKAPYVKDPIKNVSVIKRAADKIIDLTTVFADDDLGDVLINTVTSNTNNQVVTAKITGSQLTLSFSTVNIGTSQIEITASSNGKVAKSQFTVEVTSPTGIDPLSNEVDVQIYPNPTNGKVQINFGQTPAAGIWITIYSITGKVVSKSLADNKDVSVNLIGNPVGLYFIKIDQKTPKTYKIVLE
jgi:hypothetical protein